MQHDHSKLGCESNTNFVTYYCQLCKAGGTLAKDRKRALSRQSIFNGNAPMITLAFSIINLSSVFPFCLPACLPADLRVLPILPHCCYTPHKTRARSTEVSSATCPGVSIRRYSDVTGVAGDPGCKPSPTVALVLTRIRPALPVFGVIAAASWLRKSVLADAIGGDEETSALAVVLGLLVALRRAEIWSSSARTCCTSAKPSERSVTARCAAATWPVQ